MAADPHGLEGVRAVFRVEAGQTVARLTGDLLALETTSEPGERARLAREIRGALHSLKGSAAMMEFAEAATLLHEVEDAFAREVGGPDLGSLVTRVLAALDRVQGLTAAQPEPEASRAPAPADPAPPATVPAPLAGPGPGDAAGDHVYVPTSSLDELLGSAEDLVIAGAGVRAHLGSLRAVEEQAEAMLRTARREAAGARDRAGLERLCQLVAAATRELAGDSERLEVRSGGVLDGLRALRMLPARTLFDTFQRPVRDLAREHGRRVRLEVVGGEVRIDKRVLQGLQAPLVHLLRNAIAHGVEPPAERLAAGKPEAGVVTVRAEQLGQRVRVVVADDGRGLDLAAVREEALRRGLLDDEAAAALTAEAAAELVFQPGFSTRKQAGQDAGRGVGLSVVRDELRRLRGEVRLDSAPGAGARFTLSVPLTIAATRGLVVCLGAERYAIPVAGVERVARIQAREISELQGLPAVDLSGEPVRLARLADLLGLPDAAPAWESAPVVLLAAGHRRLAVQVDALGGEVPLVIKDLPGALGALDLFAGAALLDDGKVVPVLDAEALVRSGQGPGAQPWAAGALRARRRVLVVDDSATSRRLMEGELLASGFSVVTACDGLQALRLLESEKVDALVSDVNMPHLDGFELTRAVRSSELLKRLPVLLVTAADTPADRQRGFDLGADAYLVKKDFVREALLAALHDALRRRSGPP